MNDKLDPKVRGILNYVMDPRRRIFLLVTLVIMDILIVSIRGLWGETPSTIIYGISIFAALEYSMLWNWTYIGIFTYSNTVPFGHAFARLVLMVFYLLLNLIVFCFQNFS